MGSDDETIIRIFVSRAEIDLRWGEINIFRNNPCQRSFYVYRLVAERYKEVSNREMKTAVEQVRKGCHDRRHNILDH